MHLQVLWMSPLCCLELPSALRFCHRFVFLSDILSTILRLRECAVANHQPAILKSRIDFLGSHLLHAASSSKKRAQRLRRG